MCPKKLGVKSLVHILTGNNIVNIIDNYLAKINRTLCYTLNIIMQLNESFRLVGLCTNVTVRARGCDVFLFIRLTSVAVIPFRHISVC